MTIKDECVHGYTECENYPHCLNTEGCVEVLEQKAKQTEEKIYYRLGRHIRAAVLSGELQPRNVVESTNFARELITLYHEHKEEQIIMTRPDWDTYFINIARDIAERATCPRASVGAVIVKDHRIISTGYNGAPSGQAHCDDVGCDVVNDHCQTAIHAEVNAVAVAAKFGLPIEGTVLYYWDSQGRPESCYNCIQVMTAAGITKVVDRYKAEVVCRGL